MKKGFFIIILMIFISLVKSKENLNPIMECKNDYDCRKKSRTICLNSKCEIRELFPLNNFEIIGLLKECS